MSTINAKFNTKLSLESIEEYQEFLKKYQKDLPKAVGNIVTKVSKVGLKDNYKSTEIIPTKNEVNKISGGIKTTDEDDTYKEFGTGIVGSQNPHFSDILAQIGWKYDINEHGEKGWVYPKEDGTFGWTKGIAAQRKFYNAIKKYGWDNFKHEILKNNLNFSSACYWEMYYIRFYKSDEKGYNVLSGEYDILV